MDLSCMMQGDEQAMSDLLQKAGENLPIENKTPIGLSKKDKRAMKIQKQKDQAAKKQSAEDAEEQMEDEEIGNDEDMGEEMGDDQEPQGDPMTCLIAFKKKVTDVLDNNDLDQKRASKMEIMDFLNLLSLFNADGIHFK